MQVKLTEIENILNKIDKLTHDEIRMNDYRHWAYELLRIAKKAIH